MNDKITIELHHLTIASGSITLVHDAQLHLETGWVVGLVGASGSGKSLTARGLCGLIDCMPGVVQADLAITTATDRVFPYSSIDSYEVEFSKLRGKQITYLPQDARGALFSMWTIRQHFRTSIDPSAWLQRVGFQDPTTVLDLYPHELSGGMAQRASLALALAKGSRIFILDEPTSALDPISRLEVVDVFRDLVARGAGLLWITHDLRELSGFADEIVVMHEGRTVDRILGECISESHFHHPAARALYRATYSYELNR